MLDENLKDKSNSLSPLNSDGEFHKCRNHGHETQDCKSHPSSMQPVEIENILSNRDFIEL